MIRRPRVRQLPLSIRQGGLFTTVNRRRPQRQRLQVLNRVLRPNILHLRFSLHMVTPAGFRSGSPALAISTMIRVLLTTRHLRHPTRTMVPLRRHRYLHHERLQTKRANTVGRHNRQRAAAPRVLFNTCVTVTSKSGRPLLQQRGPGAAGGPLTPPHSYQRTVLVHFVILQGGINRRTCSRRQQYQFR